jgi:hypothetical protein
MTNILNKLLFNIPSDTYMFTGDPRDSGYYYFYSHELPGFTLLLEAKEVTDIGKLSNAFIEPLTAYMAAYFKYLGKDSTNLEPRISYADLRGTRNKKCIYFTMAYN